MFSFFKKKKPEKSLPPLNDLNNHPLGVGDKVLSHRYDLGNCIIKEVDGKIVYESIQSGEQVSWVRMIDAVTDNQKVSKIIEEDEANEPASTSNN